MDAVRHGGGRAMRRAWSVVLLILGAVTAPAAADEYTLSTPILIQDATVVAQPGRTLPHTSVLIEGGRIRAVGLEVAAPAGARVIDGSKLYVYAGFVDTFTRTGLGETKTTAVEERRRDGVRRSPTEGPLVETLAASRFGFYPERTSLEMLDVREGTFRDHRAAGFTTALIAPPEAMMGGHTALISLGDEPLRDSVIRVAGGQTVRFEPLRGRALASQGRYPGTPLGVIASIRQILFDAQWYRSALGYAARHPEYAATLPHDESLTALQRVISGDVPLLWEADTADEIDRVLDLTAETGTRPWIVGARRAYERLDRLAARQAPLVISLKQPDKPRKYELDSKKLRKAADDRSLFGAAWEDRPFSPEALYQEMERDRKEWLENPREAHVRGLRWCFSAGSEPGEALARVREYIEAGLPVDAAVAALTTSPSEMLGVEGELGTVAVGKRASLTLLSDVLGAEKAAVRYTIVDGHVYEFEAKRDKPGRGEKGEGGGEGGAPRRRGRRPDRMRNAYAELNELHCDSHSAYTARGQSPQNPDPNRPEDEEDDEDEAPARQSPPQPSPAPAQPPADDRQPRQHRDPVEKSEVAPSPEAASQPTSAPASQPAEEIPPGPLDEYLQHTPKWDVETKAMRLPPFDTNGNIWLRNATVLTVTNGVLEDADILVQDGKITKVGAFELDAPPPDTRVIDLSGYVVMPAVIDPHAHIALDQVNEGTASVTPEVRVGDVIDSEQRRIYDAAAGGCTTIHAMHGSANTIGGQNVLLKMKYGTSAAEMRVPNQVRTVKFATGENVKQSRGDNTIDLEDDTNPTRFPKSRMGVETTMRRAFAAGAEYLRKRVEDAQARSIGADAPPLRRDLRLEALADILSGDLWINMHCYRADEVLRALEVAESFGVRIAVLHHILEGYRIMPEIFRHGAGTATFSDWWAYKIEAYDAVPQNAGLLLKAGVNSTIKSDSADLMRHMNLEAQRCMSASLLTSNEALRLITSNAARLFALQDRLGSIEVGKEADLAVFDGHPLDTFSRCVMTLIDGEVYFLHREFSPEQPAPPRRKVREFFQDRLAADPENAESWSRRGEGRFPPEKVRLAPIISPGQSLPPARAYALAGGTIHPVSGPDEVGGTLVIRDGRIAEILGEGAAAPDDCMVVDVRGLHVYPGLINAATRVGIQEIEAIPVTVDLGEVGRFQPDVFSLSAFNPHSRLLGVARDGGVLAANVIPAGPIVAGQSGLVHLAGWTLNEMVQLHASGLVVRVPSIPPRPISDDGDDDGARNERRRREDNIRKRQNELRDFFENAQRYAAGRTADPVKWPYDPRYEQMRPYVTRTRPVLFAAGSYKEILEALMFAEQMDVSPIILGGRQAWRLADLLAQKEVPVIYEGVMELPEQFEAWDANYRAASVMDEAGVEFCFAHGDADLAKQLASEAGWAVAHGLAPESALHAITLAPAEILGVDDQLGSLDVGKLANVLVTTDDVLQVSHRIVHAFVRGEPVAVDSAHAQQAHTFVDRPAPALPPARDDLHGSPSQSAH